MTQNQIKQLMAQQAQQLYGSLYLSQGNRPSDFLAGLGQDWNAYWEARVTEKLSALQMGVWEGGLLPNGLPAPEGAGAGAAYWIVSPNGGLIFQYGDSPYAPSTPGLAPGALTPENAEAAMQAHAQAIAENHAAQAIAEEYLAWLGDRLL